MHPSTSLIAVLLASVAFGASAQTTGAAAGQPATGETYRPTLDGQPTSAPAPTVDMRPMTENEKATGRQEPSRLKDIDPAVHPAPQNVRPQPSPTPRAQPQGTSQPTARRSVQQQIDSSARLATPHVPDRAAETGMTPVTPATPAPVGPTAAQVTGCVGAACTDSTGAMTTGSVGNASVNSNGRLCNRSGNTVQCL